MATDDPDKLADSLEREADELQRESRELGGQVEEARQDWERKRRDESVPGAPPPEASDAAGGEPAQGKEPPKA